MIQLTVTDTLQNFTNDYIFKTQEDMTMALHMLFDFAGYTKESVQKEVLQLRVTSEKPLDTGKSFYNFKRERKKAL